MFELQDQFNKIFNFEYLYEFEAAFFWLWNIFFLAVGGVGLFLGRKTRDRVHVYHSDR
jgi:hypothetical protein